MKLIRQAEVEASRDSDEEVDYEGITPLGETLPPGQVKDVPQLLPYLKVIMKLTAGEDPPMRRV
jgi:hypothetical protein